jgi:ribosomal-protein-alanine N-acetyltransferase
VGECRSRGDAVGDDREVDVWRQEFDEGLGRRAAVEKDGAVDGELLEGAGSDPALDVGEVADAGAEVRFEFEALLEQDTVFGFAARETGRRGGAVGFVLARLAAGEGEVLTVAVARSHRRLGLGWKLLDAVLRELHRERAGALFLEVDETNAGAIALYKRLGFKQVGRRPGYYAAEGKPASGALVMRRDLR